MKKLVPDPPPVLCIRAGISHEKSIHLAQQHIDSAMNIAHEIAAHACTDQQERINAAILQMQITRALLKVSAATLDVVV
ncbi:hypothetical protein N7650_03020 [Pseudomonas sp. GD04058]|uniref:hypothetical protein n=1 Tax=Pseudomonas sp. GD04058 TaxID=2975429 RepID=UPI002448610A|nr:hypothetical protein [Pseudomonas sp. GD04058]MDG9881800.1 hypothetical protein [Pseudomonas sp. GD04058]